MGVAAVLAVLFGWAWGGAGGALLGAAAGGAAYLLACAWYPMRACSAKHCEGGRVRSPDRKKWRRCGRCKGKGAKVRAGRRVFDVLRGRRGADV